MGYTKGRRLGMDTGAIGGWAVLEQVAQTVSPLEAICFLIALVGFGGSAYGVYLSSEDVAAFLKDGADQYSSRVLWSGSEWVKYLALALAHAVLAGIALHASFTPDSPVMTPLAWTSNLGQATVAFILTSLSWRCVTERNGLKAALARQDSERQRERDDMKSEIEWLRKHVPKRYL